MIRKLLIAWLFPVVGFWGWYALSVLDTGFVVFTRELHDRVFAMYGRLLGIAPELIAPMVAKGLVLDSAFVLSVMVFRQRRAVAAWARLVLYDCDRPAALCEESLSSAP